MQALVLIILALAWSASGRRLRRREIGIIGYRRVDTRTAKGYNISPQAWPRGYPNQLGASGLVVVDSLDWYVKARDPWSGYAWCQFKANFTKLRGIRAGWVQHPLSDTNTGACLEEVNEDELRLGFLKAADGRHGNALLIPSKYLKDQNSLQLGVKCKGTLQDLKEKPPPPPPPPLDLNERPRRPRPIPVLNYLDLKADPARPPGLEEAEVPDELKEFERIYKGDRKTKKPAERRPAMQEGQSSRPQNLKQ